MESVSRLFHSQHSICAGTLAAVLLVHVDELHVQLDGVHIGVLEHVQRRIAAAEVAATAAMQAVKMMVIITLFII